MTNSIHPTAIISGDVTLGRNNQILAYTVLEGPLDIGDNNIIGPHAVIGTPGQNTREPRYDTTGKKIRIGNNNIIREFTGIQKPCFGDITELGSNNFLMQSVHVPHDALIEDDVTLTPTVVLAGSTIVLKGAVLGLGVTVHQRSIIGQYSMVAMNATVVKNIKPFSKFIPGKDISVNEYVITKLGWESYADEIRGYVLENHYPTTSFILDMVKRYDQLHEASGRQ
jgi:UDP-N-acetylglucosamine acyltransferase